MFRNKKYDRIGNNKIYEEATRNSQTRKHTYNSQERRDNDYYGNFPNTHSMRSSYLKQNALLRNYSENTLRKEEKNANYLNVVKMSNKGNYPQTARNYQGQAPSMLECVKANQSNSGLTSPQRDNVDIRPEMEYSKNGLSTHSYSNIFKQRRNTNISSDQSRSNSKSSKTKHNLPKNYFYQ